jgi:hypothetical protein
VDIFAAGPLEWAAAGSLILFTSVICFAVAVSAIAGLRRAGRRATEQDGELK